MNSTERDIALELLSDAVRESSEPLRLQIRGVCMRPLVQDGDWVQCRPFDLPPRAGDLVLARDARSQLVCHRILGEHDGLFRLAGDRTFAIEDHSLDSILGRVTHIERPDSAETPSRRRVDLSRTGWFGRRLNAGFAAWHLFSDRHRQGSIGRILESLRWRLVVLRHRWIWWMGRG